jgi:hypothetical protein
MNKKNLCGKTRKIEHPYEVWTSPVFGGCEYRILKKYQSPEAEAKNPYARWMVAAKSPATFGGWDMGDTYIKDITTYGTKVYDEATGLGVPHIFDK